MQNLRYRLAAAVARLPFRVSALFISAEEIQRFERQLVIAARERVPRRVATEDVVLRKADLDERMVFGTFNHCGVFARALEAELNAMLGFTGFAFKRLDGHYVVKSRTSGLIYDLVTVTGLPEERQGDLDYADYLTDKMAGTVPDADILEKYVRRYRAASAH